MCSSLVFGKVSPPFIHPYSPVSSAHPLFCIGFAFTLCFYHCSIPVDGVICYIFICGWRDLLYIIAVLLWMVWSVIYLSVDGVICYISVDGIFIIAVFLSPAFICDVSDSMPRSRRNGGVTLMGYPCLMIGGRDFVLEVLKWTTPMEVAVICFYFPALTHFSLAHLFPSRPA